MPQKKKSKKKKKKVQKDEKETQYQVDPVTGEPTRKKTGKKPEPGGQILYSGKNKAKNLTEAKFDWEEVWEYLRAGIDLEDVAEELGVSPDSLASEIERKRKVGEVPQGITKEPTENITKALKSGWEQLQKILGRNLKFSSKWNSGNYLPAREWGKIKRNLSTVRSTMVSLLKILPRLGIHKEQCALRQDYDFLQNLAKEIREGAASPIRFPGRTKWWGRSWSTNPQKREYLEIFLDETFALFLGQLKHDFIDHSDKCEDPECEGISHSKYLIDLLCNEESPINLMDVYEEFRVLRNRSVDILSQVKGRAPKIYKPPSDPVAEKVYEIGQILNKYSPGASLRIDIRRMTDPEYLKKLIEKYGDILEREDFDPEVPGEGEAYSPEEASRRLEYLMKRSR